MRDILAWSRRQFGALARGRYAALIARALRELQRDPLRTGVQRRPELGAGVASYHLHFGRGKGAGRLQRPRHVVFLRADDPGFTDILRVLRDAMEVSLHLPAEPAPMPDTPALP